MTVLGCCNIPSAFYIGFKGHIISDISRTAEFISSPCSGCQAQMLTYIIAAHTPEGETDVACLVK